MIKPRLTPPERACFNALLHGWADAPQIGQMRRYIQHGCVTTYEHCLRVAKMAFWLNRRLNLRADELSLVRGAMLHDFYLYDWHDCDRVTRWHGLTHPAAALKNADALFELNDTERDIILNHMWPLTLRHCPRSREAAIVCLADKLCSGEETVLERRRKHPGGDPQK